MEQISDLFDLFGETVYCTICLEDVNEASRVRCLNACNHIFHSGCIEKWFSEKSCCPTCRKEYTIIIPKSMESEIINDIDRLFLTWTLIHGILKKNNTAIKFNEKKQLLRNLFQTFQYNTLKAVPVDLDSRYSLCIMKEYIGNRISKNIHIEKNKIHRQPQIFIWIDRIENSGYTNIRDLWHI